MISTRNARTHSPGHIAIVGLGQIGGSIVLALRKNRFKGFLTGIDASRKRLRLISPHMDAASGNWSDAWKADLVVLCLHYNQLREILNQAPSNVTLLDVCSSKKKIVDFANRRRLRLIGGHPLAGNEFQGEKGWREDLFENATFFLCPGSSSGKSDLGAVMKFLQFIGATPMIVDPLIHDRSLAATSHFPAFLSLFLKQITKHVPIRFQGPGYRSMTRLSVTPPELLNTYLQSNRSEILKCSRKMQRLLEKWIRIHSRI